MNRIFRRWASFFISLILGAITLAAFGPVLKSDFIKLDDREYVTENPQVRGGLSVSSAAWAVSAAHSSNWHPLTWISHMLDVEIFGLRPAGHHLTSLILHVLNVVILFQLLFSLTEKLWQSAMVATLFAIHPLHVESVAWIAERKDVLSAFWFLLAIAAYTRYARTSGPRAKGLRAPLWYAGALVAFVAGLMSKPMVVTLPLILWLLDWWPLRRMQAGSQREPAAQWQKLVVEKVPFAILAAASCSLTWWAQASAHSVVSELSLPFYARIANAAITYWKYLGQTLWPVDLAIFYPHPWLQGPGERIGLGLVILSASGFAAVCAGVWFGRRRLEWLATGWAWYVIMLLPVIGLIQVGAQARADRYTYLPLIGIFICVVWGASQWLGDIRQGRIILGTVSLGVIVACGLMTHRQSGYWRDNLTVFLHAAESTRNNALVSYNLGVEYSSRGDHETAIVHYRRALELVPGYATAQLGLANALLAKGKSNDALEEYAQAVRQDPNNPAIHNNLGVVLRELGRTDAARQEFETAVKLDPAYVQARCNLGKLLAGLGELAEAENQFRAALTTNSDSEEGRNGLGNVLLLKNQAPEAQAEFEAWLRIAPANPNAALGLGEALRRQGKLDPAIKQFETAVRLSPGNSQARFQLGEMLSEAGRYPEAEAELGRALQANPRDAQGYYQLGVAQARQGKSKLGSENFRKALELRPNFVAVMNDWGWMLATDPNPEVRNGAEAVRLAERACELAGARKPAYWITREVAYAEAGRFEDAIQAAGRNRANALAAGQVEVAAAVAARLELYLRKQAYHQ